MKERQLANFANYNKLKSPGARSRLHGLLDQVNSILGIEFGSVTIRIHNGKWSPKIEIVEHITKEVK